MTGPFASFFELRDNPFRANPDPHYLFLTQQTKENLDQIIEGIRGRKGLLLLTGEVGTGKTVLLNRLMGWLEQERIPKAFIFNSHLKAGELLDLVVADFRIPFSAQRGTPLAHLHSWLQDRHCAGQTPVLFVDEAQGLGLRTLEELRMLLNLQASQGSLLQIVLCGQPEFEETLKRPELRQLRQRIALRCRTSPLTLEETQGYIDARLRVAGSSRAAVFQPEAVQALSHYSRGLPRVLNALCEQSLMRAAREKIRPVPGRVVGEAAHELQYDEIGPFVPFPSSDDSVFSGLFGHLPDFAETPEIFAAAAPLTQDAPLDAAAPAIPSREPERLARAAAASVSATAPSAHGTARSASAESSPGAPRISHAPIMFPSPSPRQSSPSPASQELVAMLASAPRTDAPTQQRPVAHAAASSAVAPRSIVRNEAARQKSVFRAHWKQRRLSVANSAKSALATIASASRIRLAQLQTHTVSLFGSLSRQLSVWRNKTWKAIKIDVKWSAFASSCLSWLQAPSLATRLRHASSNPQVNTPRTESSARILATQPLHRRSLPRAGRSKIIGSLKAPSLSTSILHWLQEPSHAVRKRKSTRSSTTPLP